MQLSRDSCADSCTEAGGLDSRLIKILGGLGGRADGLEEAKKIPDNSKHRIMPSYIRAQRTT